MNPFLLMSSPEEPARTPPNRKSQSNGGKRVFGYFELIFDALYLISAYTAGIWLLTGGSGSVRVLSGVMVLVLAGGDSFHLLPRMTAIIVGSSARLDRAMGFGKFVTSISMTAFYVLMWHIGLLLFQPAAPTVWTSAVYILAALRVVLCLFPQNKWLDRNPPVSWSIIRNIPFTLLGLAVLLFFGLYRASVSELQWAWLAISFSFAFYLPVVLWNDRFPKLGMLMLPKTCAYLWMIYMFLSI